MPESEPPCECTGPGYCPRYKMAQSPMGHAVCTGRGLPGLPCSAEASERYRRRWRLQLLGDDEADRVIVPDEVLESAPSRARPSGGPGTELKRILVALGLTADGCQCESRASRMDEWGVAGCRQRRAEIEEWLRGEYARRSWGEKVKAAVLAVSSGLAFHLDPFDPAPGLLEEAICRAAAAAA